jgi:hypothetical protein
MADVTLRSPFNGQTIAVPPDDPQLPVLLQAGFVREDPPPKKEKRSHG